MMKSFLAFLVVFIISFNANANVAAVAAINAIMVSTSPNNLHEKEMEAQKNDLQYCKLVENPSKYCRELMDRKQATTKKVNKTMGKQQKLSVLGILSIIFVVFSIYLICIKD